MAKRLGRTLVSASAAREYAFRAANQGADHAPLAGNCESPVMLSLTGLRDSKLAQLDRLKDPRADYALGHGWLDQPAPGANGIARNVDLAVRCRKCPPCLKARGHHWKMRALSELGNAPRSWFGTLTLAPEKQFHIVASARSRLRAREVQWDELDDKRQFNETCRELTKELQLYLKRIRKGRPGLRHFAVFERHKSGNPHIHLLIHETMGPITWRVLSTRWTWGFSKFNVIADGENSKRAGYMTKYLTKALNHRCIASKAYGAYPQPSPAPSVSTEQETNVSVADIKRWLGTNHLK